MSKLVALGLDPGTVDAIIDIDGSQTGVTLNLCPCLTSSRCANRSYWSTLRTRQLTITDLMKLQGMDPSLFLGWDELISQRQMGGMIGNAMTLPIMYRIMRSLFISVGIPVDANGWWD